MPWLLRLTACLLCDPPQEEVLSVARDIAVGMAYLHSMNICHGDLKVGG